VLVIRGYRPDLDGLRTVAVYLVLLFHAGLGWVSGGFIGVDLFFCLSGFLVTGVLLGELERDGRLRVGRFYGRRVRRLLPAALVVVVVVSVAFLLVWSVVLRVPVIADARASLLYYANWHFLAASGDYFATDVDKSPFLHFWSLSIEEQYYIFFPVLLLLLSRLPARVRRTAMLATLAVLLVVSLTLQVVLARGSIDRAYYGTDARLYQLLAGALLTAWLAGATWRPSRRTAHAIGLVGLVGILVLGSGLVGWNPSWRGIGATGAAVLLLGGLGLSEGSPLSRVLAHPVPSYLGRISYGTYLWHWPVIVALGVAFDLGPVTVALVALVAATGLAALSYRVLEMPIRRWPRINPFGWRVVAVGVSLSAIVAVAVVPPVLASDTRPLVASTERPDNPPTATTPEVARLLQRPVPHLDYAKWIDTPEHGIEHWCGSEDPEACTVVRGSGPHVLLVGDSQAETLVPVFERLAREHDFTLSVSVIAGCPWQEGLVNARLAQGRTEACTQARVGWYRDGLPRLDPDVVVLLDRSRDDPAEWGATLTLRDGRTLPLAEATRVATEQSLTEITAVAPAIVLQGQAMPETFDPVECLATASRVGQCAITDRGRLSPSEQDVVDLAADNSRIHPLDVGEATCPTRPVCVPLVGDTVVWRDDHHYTVTWAMERRAALWEDLLGTGLLAG
jgi:peptidoglycan/LPS O-acetylase OafA/YrhL